MNHLITFRRTFNSDHIEGYTRTITEKRGENENERYKEGRRGTLRRTRSLERTQG